MSVVTQYVIYKDPSDHPGKFVVRPWYIGRGTITPAKGCSICDTLEEARERIPPGMFRFDREENDDPAIWETWT